MLPRPPHDPLLWGHPHPQPGGVSWEDSGRSDQGTRGWFGVGPVHGPGSPRLDLPGPAGAFLCVGACLRWNGLVVAGLPPPRTGPSACTRDHRHRSSRDRGDAAVADQHQVRRLPSNVVRAETGRALRDRVREFVGHHVLIHTTTGAANPTTPTARHHTAPNSAHPPLEGLGVITIGSLLLCGRQSSDSDSIANSSNASANALTASCETYWPGRIVGSGRQYRS